MTEPNAFRTTYCAPRRVARERPRRSWVAAACVLLTLLLAWAAQAAPRNVAPTGAFTSPANGAGFACERLQPRASGPTARANARG